MRTFITLASLLHPWGMEAPNLQGQAPRILLSPTQMVMNLLWQVDEDSGTSQNTASTNEPGPGYGALGLTLPGGYLVRGSILCWAFGEVRWWELAETHAALKDGWGGNKTSFT